MVQSWPRPAGALNISQKFEVQERLKKLGYYPGKVDGYLGNESRKAIRRFQKKVGLREDGLPTSMLLEQLRE